MAEAIINKIFEDAHAIVNSTLEEGNARASEIIAEASNDARIYREKNMDESIVLRDEIIRRRISVANLEVKKLILASKKSILDATFNAAKNSIVALPPQEYLAIIGGMLNMADDGDIVHICKRDSALVTAEFIAKKAKELGITLTLSADYVDIAGGVILSSQKMDKNISIEVELNAVREDNEARIAAELFGDN